MSFALTTDQVRAQTKTVTRRLGWVNAKAGDVVQPVVKGQGLKKGERVERIGGPIRFVDVRREPLGGMLEDDCAREGFPHLAAIDFVRMFMQHNGVKWAGREVTRIEFEYLPTGTDTPTGAEG